MTEAEIGNDAMLPEDYDPAAGVAAGEAILAAEEARVTAVTPAGNEPGAQHPDPDATPSGRPPEYDPLPPN